MKKTVFLLLILSFISSFCLVACGESDEERDQRLIFEEIKKRSR